MSTDDTPDTDALSPTQLAAAIRGEGIPPSLDPDEMDPIKLAEAIRPSRRRTTTLAPDADHMTPAEIAAAIPRY
jgi:hypothetical protein